MSESFDFVVVGAGSAGCALARRLSDDDSVTVALLEAGGQPLRPEIAAPSEYYKLWGSEIDWGYQSTPQSGTNGRTHLLPRGRVLGGTSALNGMVYLRGSQEDFDGWAVEAGKDWGWDAVRSSYEEMEQILRPRVVSETNPLSEVFVVAAQEAGFPLNPSFDEGELEGCGWNRLSIHEGQRHSSYRAFIESVLDRPNLTVMTDVNVERVVLSAKGVVSGVEVTDGTSARVIGATEVILSAGAYESPHLLMRSGIGPAGHLEERGITSVIDLPVGENLQDHLLVGVVLNGTRPISPLHAHITESCAFSRSSPGAASCDIEISFNKEMHFAPDAVDDVPRFTIIPGATRLKSRGSVKLSVDGGGNGLVIDHNYFGDPTDMDLMIEAVRQSRSIAEAPAFKEYSDGEYFPGPAVETHEQIAAYVSDNVSTWFHPAGTCRMGSGEGAVVGPDLRVLGTSGLRVADASIMPTIVSVNTNATSMMIGWKAASLILR
ncbi:MAG: hypothetical protein JWO76_2912 [Nocardioides sp.]|nr:hypothetical protein [Nocardioides sp.]